MQSSYLCILKKLYNINFKELLFCFIWRILTFKRAHCMSKTFQQKLAFFIKNMKRKQQRILYISQSWQLLNLFTNLKNSSYLQKNSYRFTLWNQVLAVILTRTLCIFYQKIKGLKNSLHSSHYIYSREQNKPITRLCIE